MAENLNYNANGSKCYSNSESNCQKYGRLYNWKTAKSACPKGWHLPSDEEWTKLTDFVGGSSTAGTKLKAASGWNSYQGKSGNGTDDFGFAALPGGYGGPVYSFDYVGYCGLWWSASEYHRAYYVYVRNMDYDYEGVYRYKNYKDFLFSVRCVKD